MKHFKFTLFFTMLMSMVGNSVRAIRSEYFQMKESNVTYYWIYLDKNKEHTYSVGKASSLGDSAPPDYYDITTQGASYNYNMLIPDTLIYKNKIYTSSVNILKVYECPNLPSITLGNCVKEFFIYSCPLITTLSIPKSVTTLRITDMAALESILIEERTEPLTMSIIGYKDNQDVLPKLKEIRIESDVVPINYNVDIYKYVINVSETSQLKIRVPANKLEEYKKAWPELAHRIVPLSLESADIVFYNQANLQDYIVKSEECNMDTIKSVVFYNGIDKYLTDKWLRTGVNPNCLFYVYPDSAMSGDNVVRLSDMTADNIVLQEGHPFKCPAQFTAKKATYTYTPSTWADGKNGWEAVCLPYEVRNFRASTKGALSPILLGTDGNFWLREFIGASSDELYFTSTYDGVMKAYTPYIVAFPGSKMGKNNLEGQSVSFIGKDVVVGADQPAIVQRNDFIFKGGFDTDADEGTGWILNSNGDGFEKTDVVGNNPFHAYFMTDNDDTAAGAKRLSISTEFVEEEGTLVSTVKEAEESLEVVADEGAVIIKANSNTTVNIYGANGALLRCVRINAGENKVEGLAKGLYIINKQKILIR